MLADAVNTYAFLGAAGGIIAALGMIVKGGFVVSKLILAQVEATAANTRAIGVLTRRIETIERTGGWTEQAVRRTEQVVRRTEDAIVSPTNGGEH